MRKIGAILLLMSAMCACDGTQANIEKPGIPEMPPADPVGAKLVRTCEVEGMLVTADEPFDCAKIAKNIAIARHLLTQKPFLEYPWDPNKPNWEYPSFVYLLPVGPLMTEGEFRSTFAGTRIHIFASHTFYCAGGANAVGCYSYPNGIIYLGHEGKSLLHEMIHRWEGNHRDHRDSIHHINWGPLGYEALSSTYKYFAEEN